MIKTGARLASAVCDTEVIVIAAGDRAADLSCGGQPLGEIGADRAAGAAPATGFDEGNALGKRYVDGNGTEVLVTKAGGGSLSVGQELLTLKESAALPSSD